METAEMSRGLVYELKEGHKIACVYQQTSNSYRVFMYDGYFDKEFEQMSNNELAARKIAEQFCFN